jgi:hypothetical protein
VNVEKTQIFFPSADNHTETTLSNQQQDKTAADVKQQSDCASDSKSKKKMKSHPKPREHFRPKIIIDPAASINWNGLVFDVKTLQVRMDFSRIKNSGMFNWMKYLCSFAYISFISFHPQRYCIILLISFACVRCFSKCVLSVKLLCHVYWFEKPQCLDISDLLSVELTNNPGIALRKAFKRYASSLSRT